MRGCRHDFFGQFVEGADIEQLHGNIEELNKYLVGTWRVPGTCPASSCGVAASGGPAGGAVRSAAAGPGSPWLHPQPPPSQAQDVVEKPLPFSPSTPCPPDPPPPPLPAPPRAAGRGGEPAAILALTRPTPPLCARHAGRGGEPAAERGSCPQPELLHGGVDAAAPARHPGRHHRLRAPAAGAGEAPAGS
jgi:hypothetical protein